MDGAEAPRHRPLVFDKMESLIKEMQDAETGVPVRSQKLFLTFIPSAFMGYDLVEWLMERFNLDESNNVEAINIANQLCQYGYIFPVNDSKNLVLKDDSSLYRFQSPYYWPWQSPRVAGSTTVPSLGPDNVEYAIYLVKRTLRNKQRHGLEEYELEALANLKKNLSAKWDFITMQAEEQVRLAKERKKGDKIVSDSQERAYWRVARPPPGMTSALEACPVPVRNRLAKPKPKTEQQLNEEIDLLKESLDRTRVKTSIALEALLAYSETFAPYDPWLTPPQPPNPWVSDDTLYWQINSPLVEIPTEKRVQKWAISIDELVADPTGLQEFTNFLRKEYSHENIRFWTAVTDLHYSSSKEVPKKLEEIYEEFLKPGAPCEINIDGATSEKVAEGMRSGSRYAFDHAADHVFNLLLKKDCYPRFIRSDHFQRLLAEGKNVLQKKAKFFNFGGGQVKKKSGTTGALQGGGTSGLGRRRGSERSLSGSAHELAICSTQPARSSDPTPAHSHSQSNLCDIRDPEEDNADVAPWEGSPRDAIYEGTEGCSGTRRRQDSGSSSSEMSTVVNERRRLPQQSTLDGGLRGANPPLRRLSAVEPRHLTPLASPPHSPRPPSRVASTTAQVVTASHPTPTISVSSAPDDSPPDESASMDPPSVFASAAVTPTDPQPKPTDHKSTADSYSAISPLVDCPADAKDSARSSIVNLEYSEQSESSEVCIRIQDDDKPLVLRTLSLDASNRDLSDIDDLVDSSRTVDDSTLSCTVDKLPEVITPAVSIQSRERNMTSPTIMVSTSDGEKTVALKKSDSTNSSLNLSSTVPVSSSNAPAEKLESKEKKLSRRYQVAPLAVGEDIAIDDDDDDNVPLMPIQAIPSKPTPVVVVSSTNRTENIAQIEEKPLTDTKVLQRDNMESGKSSKNDVCPWEDENSCESDTPFVKTYATLGYL